MLSLPFDVLFLVCPYQPESRVRLLPNKPSLSDILRIGTHGSRESRPYEQGSAGGFDVTQVHLGLVNRSTERRGHKGS